jgi:hypothetical protein
MLGMGLLLLKELFVKSALKKLSFCSSSEISLIFNMSIYRFPPAVHFGGLTFSPVSKTLGREIAKSCM